MTKHRLAGVSMAGLVFLFSAQLSFADNNSAHAAFTDKGRSESVESSVRVNGASEGYKQAMQKMDQGMMRSMSADPSATWARMMVEHHKGAIEMSNVVLKYTSDPVIREMAERNIAEQNKSINELNLWINK
ncbi:DUF305 domain-containing protein [Pseudomonas sp. Snoq117.2]|uniref:DUF305 domain-containing protein n=1 Tax=Pseudomonas sp. Snoq117.2 TaxID=1500302 RepID=UPI000B8764E2|nr:DUF305 domain-containing protein [Pseudomonas sp. Snoq117.2]